MTRTVLSLSGPDRVPFLQDLVTNDVTRTDRLTYAALLTPQGKYLFDFFVAHDGDALLIDAPADMAEALAQRLSIYRLRRKVEIAVTDLPVGRGTGEAPEGALPDPRHPDLGWRQIGAAGDDGTDWDALRVALCVPESGIELIQNDSFPLEMGLDRLNGIDFRKGCYVGQEVTARMKHKTELKKGLRAVGIDGTAAPGTPITTEDGKPAGTLFTSSANRALAWLRFDRATGPLVADGAKIKA
ncbi:putative global regulator [Rhodobacteraceae bacterium THAF1]|uniref:CAF17-like 4Fe-4S cluster assembly/insertion protein YgfZ n=1 Tax=Palleronia sp. THAF1 TaxID=2587842 RepID=UPI000F3D8B21|nr:folate-binding protein YgfZ [Palleronia sp. THAF1]QFU09046.1 putative global regulator [Palleronia sp. THAF1]VDC24167.1 putative global regulator [Rhodobacteraceae bacterium THAF1]